METKNTLKDIGFWALIVIGIGLVVGGMIYLISRQQTSSNENPPTIETAMAVDDWVLGNRDAKVVITEYSDLQCPACGYYHPVLKDLMKEFGDRVALVYRHFPLSIHPYANTMAYAADAAGKQGKFWEMHDLIFESQNEWTNDSAGAVEDRIFRFAETLKLNIEQFKKDFESNDLRNNAERHVVGNSKTNLYYTPTFFLNGKLIENPKSYDEFRNVILEALK